MMLRMYELSSLHVTIHYPNGGGEAAHVDYNRNCTMLFITHTATVVLHIRICSLLTRLVQYFILFCKHREICRFSDAGVINTMIIILKQFNVENIEAALSSRNFYGSPNHNISQSREKVFDFASHLLGGCCDAIWWPFTNWIFIFLFVLHCQRVWSVARWAMSKDLLM